MKIINTIGLVCSILCIAISVIQNDPTEAMAWFIVTMYNAKDLSFNK
jgi:hypothetical protein